MVMSSPAAPPSWTAAVSAEQSVTAVRVRASLTWYARTRTAILRGLFE
jgi:hypothetical protein